MITVRNDIDLNNIPLPKDSHCIIWASKAKGHFQIDHREFSIHDNDLITIGKEQNFTFKNPPNIEGYIVCFDDEDLPHSSVDSVCLIVILYHHNDIHNQIKIPSDSITEFEQLFSLMFHESNPSSDQNSIPILILLLQTLLLKIQKVIREHYLSDSPEDAFNLKTLSLFMESLETNHRKYHKVKEYADQMAISPRKLNDILKHNFGSTAKELISTKLFIEITAKLQFSHDSIKEIAYYFGFSSPYHLSNFFTNIKGISPQEYRDSVRA